MDHHGRMDRDAGDSGRAEAARRLKARFSGLPCDRLISEELIAERREEERQVLALTAEGSRAFVEALVDPPEPNENLRGLARKSGLARPPKEGQC